MPADTRAGNGAASANWSCLDSFGRESTLIPRSTEQRWVYSRRFVSYLDGRPIPQLSVRACQLADIDCQDPVTVAGPAGAEGWLDLTLPEGFGGYLELSAPRFVPGLWFLGELSPTKGSYEYPISLVDLQTATEFSIAVGTELDPSRGLIFLYVFDCDGVPAADIQFTSDRNDSPWYLVTNIPSFATSVTSAHGVGGFANVQPGVSLLQSQFADGTPLGPPRAVYVRPGWGTVLVIDPSDTSL